MKGILHESHDLSRLGNSEKNLLKQVHEREPNLSRRKSDEGGNCHAPTGQKKLARDCPRRSNWWGDATDQPAREDPRPTEQVNRPTRGKEAELTSDRTEKHIHGMKRQPIAKPESVDDYIAAAPKEVRGKLEELRAVIRKAAPTAAERISYGMPYYEYHGRLAYFSIWKTHLGLYLPTPTIAKHTSELAAYETDKATVRLPLDKKLPVALIRKLIRAQMKTNEARKKK